MEYNHNLIEKKWIDVWNKKNTYMFIDDLSKPKFYVLDMFPYPSGKGLHVGHIKGYTATDIISRYKKACGYSVIHPIGYDAFGLPAEQFAIKTNKHPASFTEENINNFRHQLKMMGFDHPSNLEINTTNPNYYKWTQWIFNELYKHGLAEIADIEVNWCEDLGTVLANEEVLIDSNGNRVSERGSFLVTKKNMRQWILKITKYADKLLEGLNLIDWTESIKKMQRDWIGKSEGALVDFVVENSEIKLTAFTTRPDTLFGVSFLVIAPENKSLFSIIDQKYKDQISNYLIQVSNKSEIERKDKKNKSGIFTGAYAINPINNKKIPIWIGDYVLHNYGTGIIMGTPAHDNRDYLFAKEHKLEIIQVIDTDNHVDVLNEPYVGDGKHINSDFLNGLNNQDAIEQMIKFIENNKIGKKATTYKLHDWIFSRQRYWGEPFPILFNEKNEVFLIEDLPVVLPSMDSFGPNPNGLPPLANAINWTNVLIENKIYYRETNTMPQWAGSCWYYLAYLMKVFVKNNTNDEYLPINSVEAKKNFDRFLPVDIYIGGQEHAVLHLLYARFWHRFLYDIGIVSTPEPFMNLINQGMILNSDGSKMSKSKGSLINPDDICISHGADALRLYEMFMGPITASLVWNQSGLDGARKWIDRVWILFHKVKIDNLSEESSDSNFKRAYHEFIEQAINHLDKKEFNLLISKMMVFINSCYKMDDIPKKYLEGFNIILSFICPFIAEELNEFLGNDVSVSKLSMPTFNPNYTIVNNVTISCMINGKFRDSHEFKINETEENIKFVFLNSEKTKPYLLNKEIKKIIFIPNKTISFVV
ncbi:leucine--tRNA ligase [Mycoplasmoides alvi]|uniref:leucine--tRNA ligase n=1 Tax=Mycoplasmoides alvi TaxID=78580 RepID=UPI00051BD77E|nr:leucine--tRNA ligase [Mycoplasmoides alvi]